MTLALSVGDPAGVGPIVALRAAARARAASSVLIFGDADRLAALAAAEGLPPMPRLARPTPLGPAEVALVHVAAWSDECIAARGPTAAGGAAQLAALAEAARAVSEGTARALVTGPVSKEAVTLSGARFVGQTEWLAVSAGLPPDAVTMLFLGPRLRTALVTTHVPLRDVADAVTAPRVERSVVHLGEALVRLCPDPIPVVGVTGLNPHAGEGGLFGDEEARVLRPALDRARAREPYASGAARLAGIYPAETAFRLAATAALSGVVAATHDQATIASKLLDWGEAVNVTWGLPFVRTSVDHGVGYEAAAGGSVEESGMVAAVAMALRLAPARPV